MSTLTSIEWTDVTWNPVRGCSLVSAGCANCYAMKQAHRFSGNGLPYDGLTEMGPHGPRWTGKIQLVPEAIDAPLHWKKPRRIFVNSMSDLFHEDVPDEFIQQVWATMACADWHTFQILTKRPERMHRFLCIEDHWAQIGRLVVEISPFAAKRGLHRKSKGQKIFGHLWLGVSVEDQATAEERVPILLQTPAAVRWVSVEPMLGPIQLGCGGEFFDYGVGRNEQNDPRIHWVVVGGESGPGARPCDMAWIRSIVQQCRAAQVPCFVKQLGSQPFVVEGSQIAQEWYALGATAFMDDCGSIHAKDKKGGDMAEWPEDLRVREWPR
jgi:protein gp37